MDVGFNGLTLLALVQGWLMVRVDWRILPLAADVGRNRLYRVRDYLKRSIFLLLGRCRLDRRGKQIHWFLSDLSVPCCLGVASSVASLAAPERDAASKAFVSKRRPVIVVVVRVFELVGFRAACRSRCQLFHELVALA